MRKLGASHPRRAAVVEIGRLAAIPDATLDAESLVRLVYGGLDSDHTPPGTAGPELGIVRQVFPGP